MLLSMYKDDKLSIEYIPKRCRKSDVLYFHTAFKEWCYLTNRVTSYAAASLRNKEALFRMGLGELAELLDIFAHDSKSAH